MQRTMQKVTALVASYNEKLEARGICIEASRKYFETSAHSYLPSRPTLIDYFIENKLDMREKKKGYGYRKNSFYCIVLRLCPIDSALVPGRLCREYSFVIKSTTRMYIGETPKEKRAPEEKLLAKIERLLKKIVSKSKRKSPAELCRSNFSDIFRYLGHEYSYNSKIFEKPKILWNFILAAFLAIIFFAAAFVLHLL